MSKSLFANAWFSRSILSFSLFLTEIFSERGPTELLLPWKAKFEFEIELPIYEIEIFFAILLFYFVICLILFGAIATLDHFPHDISTSLLRST